MSQNILFNYLKPIQLHRRTKRVMDVCAKISSHTSSHRKFYDIVVQFSNNLNNILRLTDKILMIL